MAEPTPEPVPSTVAAGPPSRAQSCWGLLKSCLGATLGLSIMAYAEWLGFEREQRKQEFFAGEERRERIRRELGERLEELRASRPPLDFSDLWEDYDRAVEESRRRREQGIAAPASTAPSAASPTPSR